MLATPEIIREAAQPYRLGEVLPRWLKEVPLYQRSVYSMRTSGAPELGLENFPRLPFITKRDIRQGFPGNFLRAGMELETLLDEDLVELEQTSGTSEARTPLLLGRGWWAEQEERALRLNRVVAGVLDEFAEARRVTISSPVCNGDVCYTGVPARSERVVGNALFVNLSRHPFLWSQADLARMVAEALAWQPLFLDVDPVYGLLFARYCEREGIRLPSLRFILASYEFVSVAHRRILQRAFGVPVFNLYGSTETGHLLMEDESGKMKPSYETAFLEVLQVDARGVGELVVTTLTNDYMPLIRYRIGDLVERNVEPYRTAYQVHGRVADAFTTPAGQRVTTRQVDECFGDQDGIAHYQLRQQADGAWRLQVVPDGSGPDESSLETIRQRLKSLLATETDIVVQRTDVLLPESSGKFRLGYPAR
jgi:phenylacetate-CoA ligase